MDKDLIDSAVERAMRKEMEWGFDDCSLWVCDIILEHSGVDLAQLLRGKYASRSEAYRLMNIFSGGGLVETAVRLAKIAGLKRVEFPWDGCLVGIVADANGPALALFWNDAWLGRTERGVTILPPSAGVIAWEVPPCRPL